MKIIYIFLFTLLASKAYSQAGASVVTDPGAYAHLAESVKSAQETTQSLNKQLEMLKKAKEAYDKVNSSIRTIELMDRIVTDQMDMIKRYKASFNRLERSNLFTPKELRYMLYSFTSVISDIEYQMKMANRLIQDDLFKMTDADRLKFLTDIANKTSEANANIYSLSSRFERVRQKKQLYTVFGR